MKKYLLESVYDRNIATPQFFDCFEDAYFKMREEFADVIGYDEAEAEHDFKDADEEEFCGITNTGAWADKYGHISVWKLSEVDFQ